VIAAALMDQVMPSPFPGMDPYLVNPALWETVHHWLISGLAEQLSAVLPEPYWVAIEQRTYLAGPEDLALVGRPDASVVGTASPAPDAPGGVATLAPAVEVTLPIADRIREGYLEIRDPGTGDVVTVVEVLSPGNKRPGTGRREYLRKREAVIGTETNLIEIDLLRAGPRMPMGRAPEAYDYGVMISRGAERPRAVLLPFTLRDPLPRVPVPLRPGEQEQIVNLQALLHGPDSIYNRGHFERFVDYGRSPEPPLPDSDAAWADALLQERRSGRQPGQAPPV
jgi:hypothetical protein